MRLPTDLAKRVSIPAMHDAIAAGQGEWRPMPEMRYKNMAWFVAGGRLWFMENNPAKPPWRAYVPWRISERGPEYFAVRIDLPGGKSISYDPQLGPFSEFKEALQRALRD
jgi:hypothetical protein